MVAVIAVILNLVLNYAIVIIDSVETYNIRIDVNIDMVNVEIKKVIYIQGVCIIINIVVNVDRIDGLEIQRMDIDVEILVIVINVEILMTKKEVDVVTDSVIKSDPNLVMTN